MDCSLLRNQNRATRRVRSITIVFCEIGISREKKGLDLLIRIWPVLVRKSHIAHPRMCGTISRRPKSRDRNRSMVPRIDSRGCFWVHASLPRARVILFLNRAIHWSRETRRRFSSQLSPHVAGSAGEVRRKGNPLTGARGHVEVLQPRQHALPGPMLHREQVLPLRIAIE